MAKRDQIYKQAKKQCIKTIREAKGTFDDLHARL